MIHDCPTKVSERPEKTEPTAIQQKPVALAKGKGGTGSPTGQTPETAAPDWAKSLSRALIAALEEPARSKSDSHECLVWHRAHSHIVLAIPVTADRGPFLQIIGPSEDDLYRETSPMHDLDQQWNGCDCPAESK